MLQRMNAAAQKGKGRNPRKPSRDQQEVIGNLLLFYQINVLYIREYWY